LITILNTLGIPDNNLVKIVTNNGDMRQFTYEVDGNSNIITNRKLPNIEIVNVFLGGVYQNIELNVGDDVVIFNSISNPDCSTNALNYLSQFIRQATLPVVNYPSSVLETSRDKIYKNLKDLDSKIIIPRCDKIIPNSIKEVKEYLKKNNFPFPIIFRTTADHGSENMVRIDDISDLNKLEQFAFDGKNPFYIIEYKDYKSKDNNYRKIRYWIIGDEVIPRHLVVCDEWNISYNKKVKSMITNFEFQEEEKAFLEKQDKKINELCLKIKNYLDLDYFGIDCNINENNEMLIFEITPAMALLEDKHFPYINYKIKDAENALIKLIKNKSSKIAI